MSAHSGLNLQPATEMAKNEIVGFELKGTCTMA